MESKMVPVFSPPTPAEAEALQLTASYLRRVGTEAGTRLMGAHGLEQGKVELIVTLWDEMRESAALCDCLIALFDGWECNMQIEGMARGD
jgi:hypothetical protein